MRNARKRRTTNLHKNWEYKKPEIVRRRWTNENAHTYIKQREHFVKSLSCGYNIVIILPLAFQVWRCYYNDDERRKPPETATHLEK